MASIAARQTDGIGAQPLPPSIPFQRANASAGWEEMDAMCIGASISLRAAADWLHGAATGAPNNK